MKFWKYTLITALAFIGVSFTVLYSSCVKDSCTDLKCKNGGSCADGFCRCPTGYEGAECEIKVTARFVGSYYGNVRCDMLPGLVDTLDIFLKSEPVTLSVVRRKNPSDTLSGTAAGNTITIADFNGNNTIKYANAVLDPLNSKKVTFYWEYVSDVNQGTKTTCSFVGFKP